MPPQMTKALVGACTRKTLDSLYHPLQMESSKDFSSPSLLRCFLRWAENGNNNGPIHTVRISQLFHFCSLELPKSFFIHFVVILEQNFLHLHSRLEILCSSSLKYMSDKI